jgi:serine protease Do
MRLSPVLAALALLAAASRMAAAQDDATLRSFETGYARAIDKAAAVTVSIKVDRAEDSAKKPARMTGNFMGGAFAIRPLAPVSGFIVDAEGYIATTYFNVQGKLKGVEVTLPDGTIHAATVMGWNAGADIALLKIEAAGLPTLAPADPADFRTGDVVVAVGRTPDGRGVTANPGILSAAGRQLGRSVQVDARLNYGNVGGPLVNLDGKLVGMSCRINLASAGDRGQNSGVSFVLTNAKIAELLPDLKKSVRVEGGGGRPFLGVMGDQQYTGEGALIRGVLSGGSAEKAGLLAGDIIVEFNGAKISKFTDLQGTILKCKIGDTVKVKVKRGEELMEFEMPLGENPSE